jgi:hypothetical protein
VAPWDVPELVRGVGWGLVAAVLLLGVGLARRHAPPVPAVGAAVVVATCLALGVGDGGVPLAVLGGVACAGVGGALARRPAPVSVAGWALALAGAWVVAVHGDVVGPTWVRALVVVVGAVGGVLAASCDDSWRDHAPGPALLALSALGAYYAVPDTEQVAAVFGAAVVLALLGWPARAARLGAGGAAAAVTLLIWAAATGAVARPPSAVGAAVCLGMLVGVPLGAALGRDARRSEWWRPPVAVVPSLLAGHAAIVVIGARVAGHADEVLPAVVVAGVAAVAAVLAGAALAPERA